MRINKKDLFLGVFIGFVMGYCLQERGIERDPGYQNSLSRTLSVMELRDTGGNDQMYKNDPIPNSRGLSAQLLLYCPEESGQTGVIPVITQRYFASEATGIINSLVERDIASGHYQKPYSYLRNRRAEWAVDNTPEFIWHLSPFTDGVRRSWLNSYIEKLHENGYDEWIQKIRTRERDDYYNAILARLRYLYVILEIAYRQPAMDDTVFAEIWREYKFMGQRLGEVLGIPDVPTRQHILGLTYKDRASIQTKPISLPVPESLPTQQDEMRME